MSDTPRTEKAREQYRMDVYEPNPKGFVVAEPVHASFARSLERENTSLKRENNALRKEIDALTHTNQAISMLAGLPRANEIETLITDGKRLDWLLNEAYTIELLDGEIITCRSAIDIAMEEELKQLK